MAHVKNPDATRQQLLNAAFEEIYRNGFNAARLDRILAHTNVTKGALFHHFPTKLALGYAIVEGPIAERIRAAWIDPMAGSDNPLPLLVKVFERNINHVFGPGSEKIGCPLYNLALEMSASDEGFRARTGALLAEWIDAVRSALERGKRAGNVRSSVNPRVAAHCLVAVIEGFTGLAKTMDDPDFLRDSVRGLRLQTRSLSP